MSAQENKAIVRRVYAEVMIKGDLDLVDELFADEYVHRSTGSPEFRGPEGFKQLVTMYRDAFPDFHQDADELIAEGDTVVSRWIGSGTHQGEFMGIPPTGKRIEVTGVVITRLAGARWLKTGSSSI